MRVAWSPDGSELLAVVNGSLRRGDRIVDGPNILDARWYPDGSLVTIDRENLVQMHRGENVEASREETLRLTAAWLTGHHEYFALMGDTAFIANLTGRVRWRFDRYKHDLRNIESRKSAAISDDGAVLVLGYETGGYANYSFQRKEGRGWLALHTRKDKVIDRTWTPTKVVQQPMPLALDAKGKRVAFAVPEPGPCFGALRLDKDERYAKTHQGGARAVAIDDRGILTAYAYPRGVAERKLRVDYLEPVVKPTSQIAITETLWIDPDLDDIVALAFDRTSRKIACLDASGTIDVVPVP